MAGPKFDWSQFKKVEESAAPGGSETKSGFDWNQFQKVDAPKESTVYDEVTTGRAWDRVKSAVKDPSGFIQNFKQESDRQAADIEATGKKPEAVYGNAPMVLPAGAPIAAAGRIAEGLGISGRAAAGALRAPEMLSKAATALAEGKGLGWAAGRTALSGAQGTAMSAMEGPEGESVSDKIERAKSGGKLAAGIQVAAESLPVVGKTLGRLPGKLSKWAEERAFKASGAMLKDYRKAHGNDRIQAIGRYMLDNGLVKPGMSVDDIAEAAGNLEGKHGKELGNILNQLDDAEIAMKAGGQSVGSSRDEIAKKLESDLIRPQNLPGVNDENKVLQELIDEFRSGSSGEKLGILDSQDMKEAIGKQINWKRLLDADIPVKEQFYRRLYTALKEAQESQAGQVAEKTGQANYVATKSAYQNDKDLKKISEDQALRQKANRFFSPSDWGSAATGAMVGAASGDDIESKLKNAAVGATLGGVNKLRRKYGTPLVSQGLDVAGMALSKPMARVARSTAPLAESGSGIAASVVHSINSPSKGSQMSKVASGDDREQNRAPAKGEAAWISRGMEKLGISGPMADQLKQSKEGKRLLIEASDLEAGNPRMKKIKEQIQKGFGVR